MRNLEEIIRTPATGELRYRQVNSSPVRNARGNIIGSVSVVRDITDRKRAENDLKALSETLNQRVAERTKALQMLHDIAVMVNQAQNARAGPGVLPPAGGGVQRLELWARAAAGRRQAGRTGARLRLLPRGSRALSPFPRS